jgi:type IV pilus assembly protein PilM
MMARAKKTTVTPLFACEITPTGVIGGRAGAARDEIEVLYTRSLPPGALVPSLATENIVQRDVLREAVLAVLEAIGARARDVIAVVPDAACRVALLDFETLPERAQEANAIVRFRLKKSLPFDAEKAAISYRATRDAQSVKVVAAVMLDTVLKEYESLFEQYGSSPGVVVPSGIAALGLVEANEAALTLKVDPLSTSVAIVESDQLLLYRTLEHAGKDTLTAEQLADDIYPSVVYCQDNFHISVRQLLVAGLPGFAQFAPELEQHTGLMVQEIVPPGMPAGASNKYEACGVAGALLG